MARIDAFLKLGTQQGCSDVHLAVGVPPMLRMNGDLMPIKFRDLRDAELEGYIAEILTRTQNEQMRPGDGPQGSVMQAGDPGHGAPVIEADDQFGVHADAAALALDDADHAGGVQAHRHAVDDGDAAVVGVGVGFEDQAVVAVAAARGPDLAGGGDAPATVFRRAEQSGEAGAGVETRQTQPVDGAVAADQGGGVAVAEEGIIFDAAGHDRANLDPDE